ncbi:MAG: hypothetical protein WCX23_01160 [Candidatus Paceibacterota bacterium]|jgi:hypothetical protein|nr:hypothetical protein [Candidatus Paceibacterota bacterium]MDD4830736.1 hypothetical protein [Candidatus Paceibacterota bacterium]MDD4874834.1 hypothetical protein [Candidatus Paceibacterota bacterium]
MLSKIKEFVKEYQSDIILFIAVFLIALLSFAFGYLSAKMEDKQPIIFQEKVYGE